MITSSTLLPLWTTVQATSYATTARGFEGNSTQFFVQIFELKNKKGSDQCQAHGLQECIGQNY